MGSGLGFGFRVRGSLTEVLSRGGRESKLNGRGIVIPRGRSRGADAGRRRTAAAAARGSYLVRVRVRVGVRVRV